MGGVTGDWNTASFITADALGFLNERGVSLGYCSIRLKWDSILWCKCPLIFKVQCTSLYSFITNCLLATSGTTRVMGINYQAEVLGSRADSVTNYFWKSVIAFFMSHLKICNKEEDRFLRLTFLFYSGSSIYHIGWISDIKIGEGKIWTLNI